MLGFLPAPHAFSENYFFAIVSTLKPCWGTLSWLKVSDLRVQCCDSRKAYCWGAWGNRDAGGHGGFGAPKRHGTWGWRDKAGSGVMSLGASGYKRNKGSHDLWEEGTWGQAMMFRLMECVGLSSPSPKRSQTMFFSPNFCMIFTCCLWISHLTAA